MKYILINKDTGRIIAFDNKGAFQAFCYNYHHLTGENIETANRFNIEVVENYDQIGKVGE
jgi:hypothetical protein